MCLHTDGTYNQSNTCKIQFKNRNTIWNYLDPTESKAWSISSILHRATPEGWRNGIVGCSCNSAERPSAQPDRLVFQKRTVGETYIKPFQKSFVTIFKLWTLLASYKTPGVMWRNRYSSFGSPSENRIFRPDYWDIAKSQKNQEAKTYFLNVPTTKGICCVFWTSWPILEELTPGVDITSIELDALKPVSSINLTDKYYLLWGRSHVLCQLGGRDAPILFEVGSYGETIQNGDGVTTLASWRTGSHQKVDEPTLLIAPDTLH